MRPHCHMYADMSHKPDTFKYVKIFRAKIDSQRSQTVYPNKCRNICYEKRSQSFGHNRSVSGQLCPIDTPALKFLPIPKSRRKDFEIWSDFFTAKERPILHTIITFLTSNSIQSLSLCTQGNLQFFVGNCEPLVSY